jgi:hypothetical protein
MAPPLLNKPYTHKTKMYNLLDSPISLMKTPPVLIKTNIGVSVSSHRFIPRLAALFIGKQPGTSTTVFAPKKFFYYSVVEFRPSCFIAA